jgi:YihY family inner membrane protein
MNRRAPSIAAYALNVSVVPRTLRALDRFQQRHAWAGFPFAVVKKYGDDQAGSLATLIAYYGFFSVFPLMLVLVSVLGIVLADNPDLQQRIIDSALAQFPIVGPTVAEEVNAITGNVVALTVGIVAALWAGLGVVQAGQKAMNQVWNVPRKDWPNFFTSRLRSLLMLVVLGAMILASTFLSGLATVGGSAGSLDRLWQISASLLLNVVLFLLIYRVLTRLDLRWRDVVPGGLVAATLWTVLQSLGGLYVSHTIKGASNVYGTFALVIGLLVWISLGAQLTLYCAEINVVRIRGLWPRSLVQPPLTDADRRVLRAGTLVERRRPEQHIEVTFDAPDRSSESEASSPEPNRPS